MSDWITLLYSRKLTEHCKLAIMEKIKIIIKKNSSQKNKVLSFYFLLFRDAPVAYGGSQARGRIGATAAGLHYSCSNTRSEPHLRAMLDP